VTEPTTPADVMLAATKSTLRSGRMSPAQVTRQQLDALRAAGYRLQPSLADEGAAILLASAKRAFWSGRFRPMDVIITQLDELAGAGHHFVSTGMDDSLACDEFVWGPNSFESCEECGLSFWRHGEGEAPEHRTDRFER